MDSQMIVFSGNSNNKLAKKICSWLDVPVSKSLVSKFADGETRVELGVNVRGADVFIIQPLSKPANEHIMEAAIMADACVRASANRVTLVAPYFGYARQERKSAPRTPITAKLVADLIQASGFDRLLTLELHNSAIQGFFKIPVDHLFSTPLWHNYFGTDTENLMIVSPDAGGAERARYVAKKYNCGLAIIDKRRDTPNESAVMHIVGNVKDKNIIIIDDIVDTGGSLVKAANALKEEGALSISAAITHAVLSNDSVEKIQNSCLNELVVTDSIKLSDSAVACSKIKAISVAELLSKAVRRIHYNESVSVLFNS